MLGGWCATSVRLGRIIRRSNVDLVHANSGVAALLVSVACILTRTPFIWHQHDIVPSRRVNKLVLGLCGRASTSVLAVSKAVAQSLTALGVPAGRVTVLHNAVRPEFFQPLPGKPSARRSLDLPTDGFIVAMAGRLVPYKGHGLLLDAVAALNRGGLEVTAAIAGAAPEYEAPDNDPFPDYSAQLQARGRHDDLAGRVVFLGRQSDIRTVLAAADVLAVPSFLEPFPLVVLEGLASGVPVVASDSGGHPEAIRHGESGLLFKTGDVADLTEKLNQLLIDDGLRRRTSEAGRQRVRAEFSEDRFQERLLRIYDDILSGASRGLNVGAC
jgi:glycosyltransferase involved in cell wall biosynthesis